MNLPEPFKTSPRYPGCIYVTEQAPGAIPNGTIVRKVDQDDDGSDRTPIGTQGVVIGSLKADPQNELTKSQLARLAPRFRNQTHLYFIEWRTTPKQVIGCMGSKIERVE